MFKSTRVENALFGKHKFSDTWGECSITENLSLNGKIWAEWDGNKGLIHHLIERIEALEAKKK